MKDKENPIENTAGSVIQGALMNDCVKTKMNSVLSKKEIRKLDETRKNTETGRPEIF